MSLEEFAEIHQLSSNWIELRQQCNLLVARPDYWYRKDLQDQAREFAAKASDILTAAIKRKV